MALVEISVIPIGTNTPSLSKHVAQALKVLKDEKNMKYEINAMGTIIEGDLGNILGLVPKIHKAILDTGIKRIVTTIKIDDRQDKSSGISSKVASLVSQLERR